MKSIKHLKEKRVLIPSREEAGAEVTSSKVKGGKVSQSNWWTGDGKSHWCYCWESKGQKVCSCDCR